MASRSAVLIPGSTAARSFSRVRPTTRPASRMSAISRSLLYWIMACSSPEGPQRTQRALGHVVDRPCCVDADEDALAGVVPHQGRGLLVVDLEPVADGLRFVVVTLEQVAAAAVADPLRAGGVEVDV